MISGHLQTVLKAIGHRLKLAALLTTICVATAASAQLAHSAWPSYQGNAGGTGQGIGSGATSTIKWQSFANGSANEFFQLTSPVIGPDGTIYAVDVDGLVSAHDPATGNVLWTYQTIFNVYTSPAVGADGTVYVADDYFVYALDGTTGALKWQTTNLYSRGFEYSNIAIGPDGTVYAQGDGSLNAISPKDGSLLWTLSDQADDGHICFGPDGTLYTGGGFDGPVSAIDPTTRTILWSHYADVSYEDIAVGSDGTVYVQGYYGDLTALDGSTGAVKWRTTLNTAVYSYTTPALSSGGTLYAQGFYGVEAHDSLTGALLWTYSGVFYSYGSPAIAADGTVYVTAYYNNGTAALNGQTGALEWTAQTDPIGTYNYNSFAIGADGSLYVPTHGNGLFCLQSTGSAEGINSLLPNSRAVDGGHFSIYVTGAGFTASSVVNWSGTPLQTKFISSTELRAEVSNAFLASAGNFPITVTDAGVTTNALNFGVFAPNPVPTLTALSTYTVQEGGTGFTLTLTGTNFLPRSSVKWGGRSLVTTYVSPTQVTAWVPADFYSHQKTVKVDVTNPKPGGGASNDLDVVVN